MSKRPGSVLERFDGPALPIGAVTGVTIVLLGARPTGSVVVDLIVTAATLAVVTWFGVRSSLPAQVVVFALLTAFAGLPVGTLLGLLVLGWTVGRSRRTSSTLSSTARPDAEIAVTIGLAFVALATAGGRGPFGVTAVVGVAAATALVASGFSARRPLPRWLIRSAMGAAVVFVISVGGLAVAAVSARSDLVDGNQTARAGLAALESGDIDEAGEAFALATGYLTEAHRSLDRPWTQPARLVPVLAQHRRATTIVTGAAAEAASILADELASFDLDAIGPRDGRIDIEAVRALDAPLQRLTSAIERLDDALADGDSPWLISAVGDRLDRLADDTATQQRLGERATDALALAPDLLGENGARRYLVMFTTPGEARGLGGFMGNHALLTIDDGEISVGDIGRTADLNEGGDRPRTITGPDDWLGRYGPFGFTTGPDGSASEEPWSNITMSPHFPSTAAVAAELYPQSGGVDVDGVIALDVFALQEIVGAVGPIGVVGVDVELDGTNLADFLLVEQYRDVSSARLDRLELIAAATLGRLLDGGDIDPIDLGRRLAPMADQGRLVAWSADADEQQLFESIGLAGRLFGGVAPPDDAFSVRVVNSSASKIDTFLERSVCLDPGGGDSPGLATITLTNDAPATGLPEYVIGNRVGLPTGTSRLLVSWHSTIAADAIEVDGEPAPLAAQREQDAWVYTVTVALASGDSTTIEIDFDDPVSGMVHVDPQPLVRPERWAISDESGTCEPGSIIDTPSNLDR